MWPTRNIYCANCRKCIAFKIDDGEGVGPMWCLPCEPIARAEYEERMENAEAYGAAARS